MIAACIMSTGGSSGGGPPPGAPVASFRVDDSNPINGTTVNFTDTSAGAPTSWQWFINGALFSTMQNPQYYFPVPGTFIITLTATNAFGNNTTSPGSTITVSGGQP